MLASWSAVIRPVSRPFDVHVGERVPAGAAGGRVDEVADSAPSWREARVRGLDVGDPDACQRGRGHGGLLLGAGRGQQEPPGQHQPQAAEATPGQQLEDAESSDGRAEELPGPGRGGFGAAAVAVVPPQQGPQHPATVQRRAGQQVERRQQPVHDGEPLRGRDGHRRRAHRTGQRSRAQEDTGRQCAGRGPGQRDPQIGAGVGRLAFQFGDPAQHPQGDRPHAHPVSAGHHRVRRLVGQQRGKEEHRPSHSGRPIQPMSLVRDRARQDAGPQQPADQHQDDTDRPVRAHRDPGHPAKPYVLPHRRLDLLVAALTCHAALACRAGQEASFPSAGDLRRAAGASPPGPPARQTSPGRTAGTR